MSGSRCVRRDTVPKHKHTLAALCVAGVMLGGALPARAEPRPLPASVVWTRGDLFYVAAADSGVLGAGMTLRVLHGRREVATGWISRLLDLRIAVAQLDSGSLAGEKRLDKLHLLGEDAAVARAPTLRVGLPGGGRTNLLFACRAPSLAHRLGVTSYRVDSLAVERYRMVRDSADASKAPDTLLVRLYADAADQEIALERGELDVAVFWPGELSARMRGDARWRDAPKGLRARGVLVCTATAGDSAGIPTAQLDALNRDAFGGDLLPWREFEPARAFAAVPAHVA